MLDTDPNLAFPGDTKVAASYAWGQVKHLTPSVSKFHELPLPLGFARASGVRADALSRAGVPLSGLAAEVGARRGATIGATVGGVANAAGGDEEDGNIAERFAKGAIPGAGAGFLGGFAARRKLDRMAAPHMPAAIKAYEAKP